MIKTDISEFASSSTVMIREITEKMEQFNNDQRRHLTQEQADELYKAAAYLMKAVGNFTDGITKLKQSRNPTSILAGF